MIRVIFNQKGGVGKTSIACNIASCLAYLGKKVLVIDLDSQSNSSQYILGPQYKDQDEEVKNISDFFESSLKIKLFKGTLFQTIHNTPYDQMFIIPSDERLADLQNKLESRYKIFKLSQAIKELVAIHKFEEIIIDTPPSLNFYSMSALIAAQAVLIPFDCDSFSENAIYQVMQIIDEVSEDHNSDLYVEGIIVNHFQSQAKLPSQFISKLLEKNIPVQKPFLSSSIIMKESHHRHKPLIYMRPKHKLSQDFLSLSKSLTDLPSKNTSWSKTTSSEVRV